MISDAQRANIRRLFFAEHWKVGTIAAELGLHHDTVHFAIESRSFLAPVLRARAEMLDPYRDFIHVTLEQYPRLRATRLHEMLRGRGYTGSVFPVRRFVARTRPTKHEAFFRLSVMPGEQAQVDWASFGSIVVGPARSSRASISIRPPRASSAVTSTRSRRSAACHAPSCMTISRAPCWSARADESGETPGWRSAC